MPGIKVLLYSMRPEAGGFSLSMAICVNLKLRDLGTRPSLGYPLGTVTQTIPTVIR
jgi:hypothetical protein